jgi:hypothetical protein
MKLTNQFTGDYWRKGEDNHVCLAENSYTRTAQESRIVARKVNRGKPASRYPGGPQQTTISDYYATMSGLLWQPLVARSLP